MTQGSDTHAAQHDWQELLLQLPAVLYAEFIHTPDGNIQELHILADKSRSAKQIARDVQSAMMARFQIELDHRVISIAQITSSGSGSVFRSRLICNKLNISLSKTGTEIQVFLEYEGKEVFASATCTSDKSDRQRAVAEATIQAINIFLQEKLLSFAEIKTVAMSNQTVILVGVLWQKNNQNDLLVGAVYEKDDLYLSIARSVLDAVNRKISAVY